MAANKREKVDAPASGADSRVRVTVRLSPDEHQRVQYWAHKRGCSVNDYVTDAVDACIRRENGDYDLPVLEIARLNQLIDEQRALSVNVENLERSVTSVFESFLGLARGDNYLLDTETGDL